MISALDHSRKNRTLSARSVTFLESTSAVFSIALKCAGIGLLTELIGLVCADAGERAMAKALEVLGAATIVWLSLPLIRQLLSLIEGVLS